MDSHTEGSSTELPHGVFIDISDEESGNSNGHADLLTEHEHKEALLNADQIDKLALTADEQVRWMARHYFRRNLNGIDARLEGDSDRPKQSMTELAAVLETMIYRDRLDDDGNLELRVYRQDVEDDCIGLRDWDLHWHEIVDHEEGRSGRTCFLDFLSVSLPSDGGSAEDEDEGEDRDETVGDEGEEEEEEEDVQGNEGVFESPASPPPWDQGHDDDYQSDDEGDTPVEVYTAIQHVQQDGDAIALSQCPAQNVTTEANNGMDIDTDEAPAVSAESQPVLVGNTECIEDVPMTETNEDQQVASAVYSQHDPPETLQMTRSAELLAQAYVTPIHSAGNNIFSGISSQNDRQPQLLQTLWSANGPAHVSAPVPAPKPATKHQDASNPDELSKAIDNASVVMSTPTTTSIAPAGPMFSFIDLTFGKPMAGKMTSFQLHSKIDFGIKTTDIEGLAQKAVIPQFNSSGTALPSKILEQRVAEPKTTPTEPAVESLDAPTCDEITEQAHHKTAIEAFIERVPQHNAEGVHAGWIDQQSVSEIASDGPAFDIQNVSEAATSCMVPVTNEAAVESQTPVPYEDATGAVPAELDATAEEEPNATASDPASIAIDESIIEVVQTPEQEAFVYTIPIYTEMSTLVQQITRSYDTMIAQCDTMEADLVKAFPELFGDQERQDVQKLPINTQDKASATDRQEGGDWLGRSGTRARCQSQGDDAVGCCSGGRHEDEAPKDSITTPTKFLRSHTLFSNSPTTDQNV